MAKRKRKKNHWTTKNTHIQRKKKQIRNKEDDNFSWGFALLVILSVTYLTYKIIVSAQYRRGYDHFPSIPDAWIEWVK